MEFDSDNSKDTSDSEFEINSNEESESSDGDEDAYSNSSAISSTSSSDSDKPKFNMSFVDFDLIWDAPTLQLHQAVVSGNLNYCKSLIQNGSNDVNEGETSSKNTPLIFAILAERKDIFDVLLDHPSIDIEKCNDSGDTALFYAVKSRSSYFLHRLLQKGASTEIWNYDHLTPLHMAILHSKYKATKLMIKFGADVSAISGTNETMMYVACRYSKIEIICFLLYHGAQVDTSTIDYFVIASVIKRSNVEALLFEYIFDNSHSYSLNEIVEILKSKSPYSCKILETIRAIDCQHIDTLALAYSLIDMDSNVLAILSDKFPYVLELLAEDCEDICNTFAEVFYEYDEDDLYLNPIDPNVVLQNLIILIDGVIGDVLLDTITSYSSYSYFVSQIISAGNSGLHCDIIETFCYQLGARGFQFSVKEFIAVEKIFGWNSPLARFLVLLNINIKPPFCRLSYLSTILLDLNYIIGDILPDSVRPSNNDLYELTKFSAFYREVYKTWPNLKKLEDRIKVLPNVPSLTELARNSVRKMLIEKCNIKKCSIYYAVIDRLEITKSCKDILAFKQELYPDEK